MRTGQMVSSYCARQTTLSLLTRRAPTWSFDPELTYGRRRATSTCKTGVPTMFKIDVGLLLPLMAAFALGLCADAVEADATSPQPAASAAMQDAGAAPFRRRLPPPEVARLELPNGPLVLSGHNHCIFAFIDRGQSRRRGDHIYIRTFLVEGGCGPETVPRLTQEVVSYDLDCAHSTVTRLGSQAFDESGARAFFTPPFPPAPLPTPGHCIAPSPTGTVVFGHAAAVALTRSMLSRELRRPLP